MYYELYIDVLFLVNMFCDFLLLLLVRKMLKSDTSHFRIFLGSVLGGAGACILVYVTSALPGLLTVAGHIAIGACMIKIGCNTKGWKQLVRGAAALYVTAFLLGGIYQALSYYTNIQNWLNRAIMGNSVPAIKLRTFLILSIVSFLLICCLIFLYSLYKNKVANIYEVILYQKGNRKKVVGFFDTGNQLKDPLSGKPVSVVNLEVLKPLLDNETYDRLLQMARYEIKGDEESGLFSNIHYIPFHSIGKEQGLLPGLTIDIMSIRCKGESVVIRNPVLAVTEKPVSAKDNYQLIIHSLLID